VNNNITIIRRKRGELKPCSTRDIYYSQLELILDELCFLKYSTTMVVVYTTSKFKFNKGAIRFVKAPTNRSRV
jgi:hypothetical protein